MTLSEAEGVDRPHPGTFVFICLTDMETELAKDFFCGDGDTFALTVPLTGTMYFCPQFFPPLGPKLEGGASRFRAAVELQLKEDRKIYFKDFYDGKKCFPKPTSTGEFVGLCDIFMVQ